MLRTLYFERSMPLLHALSLLPYHSTIQQQCASHLSVGILRRFRGKIIVVSRVEESANAQNKRKHMRFLTFALALSASSCHGVTLTWYGEAL